MAEMRRGIELSARDREILRDVVRSYILSGEPVSSRTIARQTGLGVSAATIRNTMADLEDLGYLEQPHASAGRVPSPSGIHLYIDSLMEARDLPADDRREIEGELGGTSVDAPRLVDRTTRLLSRLSGQIGVVVTPAFGDTVLEAVDLVPLSGRRILCVIVSRTGFVEHKLVEADEELSRDELVRISNYLTENFRGLTLRSIRERLLALMSEERAQVDRLLARAILLASRGLEAESEPGLRYEGTSALLRQRDLSDVERVRRLLDTFGERQRLVELLRQCLDGSGVRVVIGADSDVTSDLGLTLVARAYGTEGQVRGTLGILGPARMPYERIIPLVDYLGEALSRALEESAGGAASVR
ncbi:MAG TPA: heat-inducible transcriptional repressor HrcA [Thermoanaerobaculia bacterium]|nr:heat-inducible transcriptional repressor HrcA [Thermoanaerobaculia bacterium]